MREAEWVRARPAHSDELGLTRRAQLTGMISAFVTIALVGEVSAAQPRRRMAARDWIDRQDELARALNDPHERSVRFIDERGEPRRLAYAAALFDFSPTHVITPHGHRHMVSAHRVVGGKFRIRNFDRLRDERLEQWRGEPGKPPRRPTPARPSQGRKAHLTRICPEPLGEGTLPVSLQTCCGAVS